MSVNYVRVINNQTINRSLLIDKIDRSQGNFSGYAQRAKQKVYIPYVNPIDTSVKGYLDLVPTDEVLLSAHDGTISKLSSTGVIDVAVVSASLLQAPVVSGASHAAGHTDITGTTFLSVTPDITYVKLINGALSQIIPSSSFNIFNNTAIRILDGVVTIGVPGAGWKVQVKANSKLSNIFTL